MSNTKKVIIGIVCLIVICCILVYVKNINPPELNQVDYTNFTKCLTEKGAKMYGSYTCTHCQEQKKMFGSAFNYVNYIECLTPDGTNQNQICKDEGIMGYPTWTFKDNSRIERLAYVIDLSDKTGCALELIKT